LNKKQCCRNFI